MGLRLASAILLLSGLVQQPARDPEEYAKTLENSYFHVYERPGAARP